MKLEGRIRLDTAEIKKALAEYVGRAYGLAIQPDQVSVYHIEERGFSCEYHASITVDDHVSVNTSRS
jgi:hypothetical protein